MSIYSSNISLINLVQNIQVIMLSELNSYTLITHRTVHHHPPLSNIVIFFPHGLFIFHIGMVTTVQLLTVYILLLWLVKNRPCRIDIRSRCSNRNACRWDTRSCLLDAIMLDCRYRPKKPPSARFISSSNLSLRHYIDIHCKTIS